MATGNRVGRPKGTPKTGGRQKGTPNKVTVEVRAAASALVDDPVYRKKLASDLRKRKVHPTIESMLWYYAKGKPKDTVALEDNRPRTLVIDRVSTRDELLEVLGAKDDEAGGDDDE